MLHRVSAQCDFACPHANVVAYGIADGDHVGLIGRSECAPPLCRSARRDLLAGVDASFGTPSLGLMHRLRLPVAFCKRLVNEGALRPVSEHVSDARQHVLRSPLQCRFCMTEHLEDPYTQDHELGTFEEFRFSRLKRDGWNVEGVQCLGLGTDDETVQNLEKCFSIPTLHRIVDEKLVPMSPMSALISDNEGVRPDMSRVASSASAQVLMKYTKHYYGRISDSLEPTMRGDSDHNFAMADANGDGKLDFSEFCAMNCVKGRSKEDLRRLYQRLDMNQDATIDKKEFRKFEDSLFATADKNNDLALDFQEFCALRCNNGRSQEELRRIFSMLDDNNDGKVDRDEFKKLELRTQEAGAKQVPICIFFQTGCNLSNAAQLCTTAR